MPAALRATAAHRARIAATRTWRRPAPFHPGANPLCRHEAQFLFKTVLDRQAAWRAELDRNAAQAAGQPLPLATSMEARAAAPLVRVAGLQSRLQMHAEPMGAPQVVAHTLLQPRVCVCVGGVLVPCRR